MSEALTQEEITALAAINRGIIMDEPYESLKYVLRDKGLAETVMAWRLTEAGEKALEDYERRSLR